MKRVVGIGACVLDTLIECNSFPKEDTKSRAKKIIKTGGGPVANALVALAKLGVAAEYLGALPKNNEGEYLIADFKAYGVKTDNIKRVAAEVFTSYIILNRETGSRTCIADGGTVLDDADNIDFSAIDGADVLHLDGNYLSCAIAAAAYAKSKGVLVSLDAGGFYMGWEKLLAYGDILIPSEEWSLWFTGEKTAQRAMEALKEKYNPKVLAITQGAQGGIYFDGGKMKKYDGFKVNCVDSNGAGDTFHGAFLAYYLEGKAIAGACRCASAAAAIKCTKTGMRYAMPSKNEIEEFLSNAKL